MISGWWWVGFNVFVLAMLALDLGVFHRKAHAVNMREALVWSLVWISRSLCFAAGLYYTLGKQPALEFLAGYLIEKSLSVDNIFVFVLIFSWWRVPREYQHRVLFWGVLSALVMRGVMIYAGAALITRFHWVIYPFGAFLLIIAFRLVTQREDAALEEGRMEKLVRRFFPVTPTFVGPQFFVRVTEPTGVRWYATPLLIVLVAVETADLIFAVDSIPAIFAVTRDPFLLYTSNVFAILGLRSLYFLLAGLVHKFRFLKPGVALVLLFVGMKMLLSEVYHIPVEISLMVIVTILAGSVAASALFPGTIEELDHTREEGEA